MTGGGNAIKRKLRSALGASAKPMGDGALALYVFPEESQPRPAGWNRVPVLFINGMNNSPLDHAESALAVSMVHRRPVIGLYNQTDGVGLDLIQCLGDKINMSNADLIKLIAEISPRADRDSVVRIALARNKAQLALYDYLARNPGLEVHAHSQGNLILCNALTGLRITKGRGAIQTFRIFSYGSPTVSWPDGLNRSEQAYTFDYVSWLGGFDWSFSVSKVGMPSGSLNPITHGFLEYIAKDAEFFVNTYRWGSLGVTLTMDEEGLGKALFEVGSNLHRVNTIFKHLQTKHNSDSDDVARDYISRLAENSPLLRQVRSNEALKKTLKEILSTGVVTASDRAAMTKIGV